jgi:hypothetical protein
MRLSETIQALKHAFPPAEDQRIPYGSIVSILADASLQSAVNYETVVAPRVGRIEREYAWCVTRSDLAALLQSIGAESLLQWRGIRKVQLFLDLNTLLQERRIETVIEFRHWLSTPGSEADILNLYGVGQKTFDYLKLICGLPAFPIDRHFFRLLRVAGIRHRTNQYSYARELFVQTCGNLNLNIAQTERSLWLLMRSCT